MSRCLNPSIQFWGDANFRLSARRVHSSASRTNFDELDSVKRRPPVSLLTLEFPSMDKIIVFSSPPIFLQSSHENPTNLDVSNEESYGSVELRRSRLSLTRFPSRALTLEGRGGRVKKKLLVINCQPSNVPRCNLYIELLWYYLASLPPSTVPQPCRVFLENSTPPLRAGKTHEPILYEHYSRCFPS